MYRRIHKGIVGGRQGHMLVQLVRCSEKKIRMPFCLGATPINRESFPKHKSYPNRKYSPILKCVHRMQIQKYILF